MYGLNQALTGLCVHSEVRVTVAAAGRWYSSCAQLEAALCLKQAGAFSDTNTTVPVHLESVHLDVALAPIYKSQVDEVTYKLKSLDCA